MNYLITYRLEDNPNHDYEEEFSSLRTAMERAYSVQENTNNTTITVYDPEGLELVELY